MPTLAILALYFNLPGSSSPSTLVKEEERTSIYWRSRCFASKNGWWRRVLWINQERARSCVDQQKPYRRPRRVGRSLWRQNLSSGHFKEMSSWSPEAVCELSKSKIRRAVPKAKRSQLREVQSHNRQHLVRTATTRAKYLGKYAAKDDRKSWNRPLSDKPLLESDNSHSLVRKQHRNAKNQGHHWA